MDPAQPAADTGLLIRVWTEPDTPDLVRARVLTLRGQEEPVTWATAAGEAAVLDAVGQWVRGQLHQLAAPALPS